MRSALAYTPGTLAAKNQFRQIPTNIITTSIPNAQIRLVDQECPILWKKGKIFSQASRMLALGYHISRFYHEYTHHDINTDRLIVCTAGLLANLCDWGPLSPYPSMKSAFQEIGVNIIFKTYDRSFFLDLSKTDDRFKEFLDLWDNDLGYVLKDTNTFLVLALIILLLMGKNINDNNFKGWFKNRVRGFSGAIGENKIVTLLPESNFPPSFNMCLFANALSSSFYIRKVLFTTAVSLSQSNPSKITTGITELIHLLRGCEMNHLVLIDRYLFSKYPEIRELAELRGLEPLFGTALKTLQSLPSEEVMYIRLLRHKSETSALNRNIFELYAAAATACARYENTTFNNYYQSDNEALVRIANQVTQYLTLRNQLFVIAAGDKDVRNMGENEKEHFFKVAIKDFENKQAATEASDENTIILPTGSINL